jgi:spermidine synthase
VLGAPGGRTPATRPRQLLTIESPLPRSHFMLRLLEPRGSCPDELWARLRAGTYDKPFVLDKGLRRMLHFDFGATQSAMLLDAPQRLLLAYTREMMTFLLFNPDPQRILLLGLGGGSIAKYCYRHLPCAEITAVEISADVIALREMFSIPADDQRFRVVRADAVAYVAAPRRMPATDQGSQRNSIQRSSTAMSAKPWRPAGYSSPTSAVKRIPVPIIC